MFYCTNTYGSVFKVEVEDKRVKARLSTSEKDVDGNYINSNWNAVFIGKACCDIARTLTDRDRIHINKCKVTNTVYTNKDGEKRSWLQVTIYDFEKLEHSSSSNNEEKSTGSSKKSSASKKSAAKKTKTKEKTLEEKIEEIDDEELPF